MSAFDAAAALRMITNARLRTAQGWAEYRDLHGALAVTSDAPIPALNCLGDFDCDDSRVESLLDLGFGLLRAFDRDSAVEITPLDRPDTVVARLLQRSLTLASRRSWMSLRGEPDTIRDTDAAGITIAGPDHARIFASIHGGSTAWVRKLSLATTVEAMLHPGNTFYLAHIEGQPVGTLHLLIDGSTAGIYAVGTLRAFRRRGVCSRLVARAAADARAAGCDLICLSTDLDGYAENLYARLGFERAFESALYTRAESVYEPPKSRRTMRRKR